MTTSEPDKLLSVEETAIYLGCSRAMVYRLIGNETLNPIKESRGTKLSKRDIDRITEKV